MAVYIVVQQEGLWVKECKNVLTECCSQRFPSASTNHACCSASLGGVSDTDGEAECFLNADSIPGSYVYTNER